MLVNHRRRQRHKRALLAAHGARASPVKLERALAVDGDGDYARRHRALVRKLSTLRDARGRGVVPPLVYVQSFEIDVHRGVMWILDVGRLNLFNAPGDAAIVNCQPKLVLYSLTTHTLVDVLLFDDDVLPANASFANDLVIDAPLAAADDDDAADRTNMPAAHRRAYITDAIGAGALVAVDLDARPAPLQRRFEHWSLSAAPTTITINQRPATLRTPADGIALSPGGEYVYYGTVAASQLFELPTCALANFSASSAATAAHVTQLLDKGHSDGMAIDEANNLYYGVLESDQLHVLRCGDEYVDSSASVRAAACSHALAAFDGVSGVHAMSDDGARRPHPLFGGAAMSADNVQWIDTFGFDEARGRLLFTSNRLQSFFNNTMDFSGAHGANFRLFSFPIHARSYQWAAPPPPSTTTTG